MIAVGEMDKRKTGSIVRPASTVAFFTLLSRIFGLIRDMVLAFAFGAGSQADAFFVAFRIPNLLRRLVAEGALTASFIPVYVDYLENYEPQDAERVVNITATLLTIVLTGLTLIGILLSPWIIHVLAPGFDAIPSKFQLTVTLNRIIFPYIFFISLVALCMGVLNANGHFAAPAAAPILLNLFMIAGALWFTHWFHQKPVFGLAAGVLLGGLSQLLLQLPALRIKRIRIRPKFSLKDPAVKRIGRLFLPAAFGAAIYQLNIFVSTLLASFLPGGSVSYLWYSNRLMEFPLGVFGVALATAAFPSLSRQSSRNQSELFRHTLDETLRLVTFIALPAMMGLIILRTPIIEVLLQRGAFDHVTTKLTAEALLYYCLGLWPIAVGRILVAAFYSLQDTTTPVKVSIVAFIGNVVMSLILMGPMLHCGLALANSLSALINVAILLFLFQKKIGSWGWGWIRDTGAKVMLASIVMGFCLWMVVHGFPWGPHTRFLHKVLQLILYVGGGGAIFLLLCFLLGVREIKTIAGILSRRLRP